MPGLELLERPEVLGLLVLGFLVITTLLIKYFVKTSKTFYIGSMIKTTRFNPLLDKFGFLGKLLDIMAYTGLCLGFGLFGIDYLFASKQNKLWKRAAILIAGFAVLYGIFFIFLLPVFSSNPSTELFAPVFPVVFAFFGLAGFVLFSLFVSAYDIIVKLLLGKKACPGVAPIIPGVQIPNVPIVVPLIAWIPLFLILIIHEGFHGIQARREKIKIKSTGLLLLGILPIGAFVEPDELQLKHKSKTAQLRVFANGATSNLFTIPIILLISFLLVPVLAPMQNGLVAQHDSAVQFVVISDVQEFTTFCGDSFPNSAFTQLEKGMQIVAVTAQAVHSINEIQIEIGKARGQGSKSVTLSLKTSSGETVERTLTENQLGRFGFVMEEKLDEAVQFSSNYYLKAAFLNAVYTILYWLMVLSFLIAIVNFLPMDPFDGGKMARIIYLPYLSFLKLSEKQTEQVFQRTILHIVLALFFLNALPLFL